MAKPARDEKQAFWIHMMEALNTNHSLYQPVPDLLKSMCTLFSFGCGFIYHASYTRVFVLTESHCVYPNDHLRPTLRLETELGASMARRLAGSTVISFTGGKPRTELDQAMAELFRANSMILIPIADHDGELMALVGAIDRRASRTVREEDMDFAYSILSTLANHIKLELYQERVLATQKSLENIMDNMGVDVYVNDFATHELLYANRTLAQPHGGAANIVGKKCWQVLYGGHSGPCARCPQPMLMDETGKPTRSYSWEFQRASDGVWLRGNSAAFHWVDGRLVHVVSGMDISENKRNEELVRKIAEYDQLTGLYNRRHLLEEYEKRIPLMLESGDQAHVLFIDLDGFKQVNDEIGHKAGDELLGQIGVFFQSNPLTRGKSYRYGGDEFVVLLEAAGPAALDELLDALQARFARPWALEDAEVYCACSIGVAALPQDDETIAGLLHKADIAMYAAKRAGDGQPRFYNRGDIVAANHGREQTQASGGQLWAAREKQEG